MDPSERVEEGDELGQEGDIRSPLRRLRVAASRNRDRVLRRSQGFVTKNFHMSEFDCNDGMPFPRASLPELRRHCELILEPMRAKFGACTVNSAYRHPAYNATVPNAARRSVHQWGHRESIEPSAVATDVKFRRGRPSDWAAEFDRLRRARYGGKGGLGKYTTFVHVDSRKKTTSDF